MKYSYDEKCLDLARHFYPNQSIAFLEALAQEFQDCVEGRETLEIPEFLRDQENLRAEREAAETVDAGEWRPPPSFDARWTPRSGAISEKCPKCGRHDPECAGSPCHYSPQGEKKWRR